MKFTTTIKKNYEFRRLYSKGKSAASPKLVVYARKCAGDTNHIGITVSTKVGKAVTRNRVRRRIREIYRLSEENVKRGYSIVIVARTAAAAATYQQLEKSFRKCFESLGLYEKEA